MEEESVLDRQLREILDPLKVKFYGPNNEEIHPGTDHSCSHTCGPFVETVCLYAEEDEQQWHRLSEHFETLQNDRLSLHPYKVSKQWPTLTEPLLQELEGAHIVLTLLSVDLLLALVRSDERIIQTLGRIARYEAEAFASFSLVLRPCFWQDYHFAQQSTVLPGNARPLSLWRRKEAAYVEVVQAMYSVLNQSGE